MKRADGTSDVERLTEIPSFQGASTWLESGRVLMFVTYEKGSGDLMLLDLETRGVQTYLATDSQESSAQASSDGRWIVYESNESGQDEIYVRHAVARCLHHARIPGPLAPPARRRDLD